MSCRLINTSGEEVFRGEIEHCTQFASNNGIHGIVLRNSDNALLATIKPMPLERKRGINKLILKQGQRNNKVLSLMKTAWTKDEARANAKMRRISSIAFARKIMNQLGIELQENLFNE